MIKDGGKGGKRNVLGDHRKEGLEDEGFGIEPAQEKRDESNGVGKTAGNSIEIERDFPHNTEGSVDDVTRREEEPLARRIEGRGDKRGVGSQRDGRRSGQRERSEDEMGFGCSNIEDHGKPRFEVVNDEKVVDGVDENLVRGVGEQGVGQRDAIAVVEKERDALMRAIDEATIEAPVQCAYHNLRRRNAAIVCGLLGQIDLELC